MSTARWFPTPAAWYDLADPENPFAAPKRRKALFVMTYILGHAAYQTGRASTRGELETSLAELANLAMVSRGAVSRILSWLQHIGMIQIKDKKPHLRIAVANYDGFGKSRKNAEESPQKVDPSHAKQENGTARRLRVCDNSSTISNTCNGLENDLEEKRNSTLKNGTANETPDETAKGVASMEDQKEIQTEEKIAEQLPEQKRNSFAPFIKESLRETLKEEKECGDPAGPRAPSSSQLSPYEKQTAEDWQAFVESRGHKRIPVKSQYEGIRKLRQLDGYTEAELTEVLTWIKHHTFWPSQVLSLLALRQRKNGVAKIETIMDQMLSEKARAAKRAADDAARKAAEKPAKKSIFDVYKRL